MVLTEDPLSTVFETVPQPNLTILHNDSGFYTRVSKKLTCESSIWMNPCYKDFYGSDATFVVFWQKDEIVRVKSDQSGAGDFLISIGVFCKIYVIPYVLYNFFSGGRSPAHNINYLLHHEICGTLGNCLNGNLARILFSCISVTLIMILAFPALIASWRVMYIIFVRYFDQPLPMVYCEAVKLSIGRVEPTFPVQYLKRVERLKKQGPNATNP
ncbi:unnamed protein product [Caenorhabditis nigoni]